MANTVQIYGPNRVSFQDEPNAQVLILTFNITASSQPISIDLSQWIGAPRNFGRCQGAIINNADRPGEILITTPAGVPLIAPAWCYTTTPLILSDQQNITFSIPSLGNTTIVLTNFPLSYAAFETSSQLEVFLRNYVTNLN